MNQPELNERNAISLLELDDLLMKARLELVSFGWERRLTGIGCFAVAGSTGIFGEESSFPISLLRDVSTNDKAAMLLSSGNYETAGVFVDTNLSRDKITNMITQVGLEFSQFGTVATFLDLSADFITDDDLHWFLFWAASEVRRPKFNPLRLVGWFSLLPAAFLRHVKLLDARPPEKDRVHDGFYKYIALSEDICTFYNSSTFEQARLWILLCFGSWYRLASVREKVEDLVMSSGLDDYWTRQIGMLRQLYADVTDVATVDMALR